MKMQRTTLAALLMTSFAFTPVVQADIYLTPWVGYTAGGSVENQDGAEFDIKSSENYALSVETDLDNGRVGMFYSAQSSDVEEVSASSTIHYLLFQSAIYYPLESQFSGYLGLGLGASYVDADWVDDKYGFSASVYGGFEYAITDNLALNSQLRWLGTAVDNDTSGVCHIPSSEGPCVIRFKTEWMNQVSANIGVTFTF